MNRYRRASIFLLAVASLGLAAFLAGCGVVDEDFQGGVRMEVSVIDRQDSQTPVFWANEVTDDTGEDGVAETNDVGEGDHWPTEGEATNIFLTDDALIVSVWNYPNPGVPIANYTDLVVDTIVLTYFDRDGHPRAFAPQRVIPVGGIVVSPLGNINFELTTAIPLDMKLPPGGGGIRDIFVEGWSSDNVHFFDPLGEAYYAQVWQVYIDVYAHEAVPGNGNTISKRVKLNVSFANPMMYSF